MFAGFSDSQLATRQHSCAGINASNADAMASCFISGNKLRLTQESLTLALALAVTLTLSQVQLGGDPAVQIYKDAGEIFFANPIKVLNGSLTRKCARDIGFKALSGKWCPNSIKEYNWLEAREI